VALRITVGPRCSPVAVGSAAAADQFRRRTPSRQRKKIRIIINNDAGPRVARPPAPSDGRTLHPWLHSLTPVGGQRPGICRPVAWPTAVRRRADRAWYASSDIRGALLRTLQPLGFAARW
jgi:hypothetical protein